MEKVDKAKNERLQYMVGKSVLDIPCKYCNEEVTYQYDTDEIEFSYNETGHYYIDCSCPTCKKGFRVYFQFKYEITSVNY